VLASLLDSHCKACCSGAVRRCLGLNDRKRLGHGRLAFLCACGTILASCHSS
jgi:hypothetical protein